LIIDAPLPLRQPAAAAAAFSFEPLPIFAAFAGCDIR